MNPNPLRIEDLPGHPDFRPLASLRGVDHDLRYATTNNFAGRVLYPPAWDCAWLRAEAAAGLEEAAAWLAQERPGHRLVVLDALRPHRVQVAIWQEIVGTPATRIVSSRTASARHCPPSRKRLGSAA